MSDEVILEAELYDRRDPNRPPVFIAPKGAKVPRAIAEKFGAVAATKARKEADVEDKAVKPAATKSTRAQKG